MENSAFVLESLRNGLYLSSIFRSLLLHCPALKQLVPKPGKKHQENAGSRRKAGWKVNVICLLCPTPHWD